MWAEPPRHIVTEALLCRRLRFEEVSPHIQDLLEHRVDLRVEEESEATGGAHGPVERSADGYADHPNPLRLVGPCRARGDEVVEHLEEVVVIADLRPTGGVVGIWLLVGHLVEHGRDEAEDTRVRLNELPKLFEDRMKRRWILVDVVDDAF